MIRIVTVEFKKGGRPYYFDPNGLDIKTDEWVIVQTVQGESCAKVTQGNHPMGLGFNKELKKVLRIASADDIKRLEENKKRETEAFERCSEKILTHKLVMNLVDAELSFDRTKLLFYFTAEGRVDFRELVKDLAATFHTRIELRQIGVRDESKMVGGIAVCGQPFCCNRFLSDFAPVSIKMAKEQGLSLNPAKISGSCGRLMCCLGYEQEAYKHLNSITPTVGSIVSTPDGEGPVVDVNVLSGNLKVRLNNQSAPRQYHRDDVTVITAAKRGKRR